MLDVVAPLAAGGSGTLYHVAVAAYSDFLRVGTDLDLPDAVAAARRPITGEGMVDWQSAIEAGHPPPALEVGLDDWCVLPYSSGTTGRPKGCLHSHRTAGFTMFAGMCWSPNGPESVSLASLPLFHVTGMQNSMNMLVFQGSTMEIGRAHV